MFSSGAPGRRNSNQIKISTMKLLFSKAFLLAVIGLATLIVTLTSCEKDDPPVNVSYPIEGLWVGTFTTVSGFVEPPGTDFYFALSIYPNGTMSYKTGTNVNAYFVYAEGTWNLSGSTFTCTAETINSQTPSEVDVSGTATYDPANGTLTNGIVNTTNPATQATWKMNRIN